ncbi:MAG: phosphate ABC transporter permease PstA [Myxococcota bacterium]
MTSQRRHALSRVFGGLTGAAAALILLGLAVILIDAVGGGWAALSWRFFTEGPGEDFTQGGIFPALYGTAVLTLLMTVAVLPFGVATAVYLHEYARPAGRLARLVRAAIHNLAGVPSIVFGLFGLGFFVHTVGGSLDAAAGGGLTYAQPGLLWAALTLAVLTLPVVIVATEEALRAVPQELRLASLALGATRAQTLMRVTLPGALPGILTGAVLAVSRGAGEVAPVLLTGVAFFMPELPDSLASEFMHLGYHTYVLATQAPDVDAARPMLYGTVLVLLALTFLLNLLAVVLRSRARRRLSA